MKPSEKKSLEKLIKSIYADHLVLLHRPVFKGNEIAYLNNTVESNFVSSVGPMVTQFEEKFAAYLNVKHCISTVNGTSALHSSLLACGVKQGHEVITQALSFVATANAIKYCGAHPVFVDVDRDTMSLSPSSVAAWLAKNSCREDNVTRNKVTGRIISGCVPMHTFGMPGRIIELKEICRQYGIKLIEDAAEALGSYVDEGFCGTHGDMGIFSFNGNKIITTGGGGMICTNDDKLAQRVRHLTTTAKVSKDYEFFHDELGFNYRMPSVNAAVGLAQLEQLPEFLISKQTLANQYEAFFVNQSGVEFIKPIEGAISNNWLNAIAMKDRSDRDDLLAYLNTNNIQCRPIWTLLNKLPMYSDDVSDDLKNSKWLEDRIVNLPSSAP